MLLSAKIFIVISSLLYGLSCLANNKKLLFLVQILSSLFYCLHCFFVRAIVGGIVTIFDLIRVVIFYILEKTNSPQKEKIITASLLLVVASICSIFSWEDWYSVLPFVSTILYIISLGISKLLFIKFASLISASCSAFYLLLSGSYFGAICECLPFGLALIGIIVEIVNVIKMNKRKKGV